MLQFNDAYEYDDASEYDDAMSRLGSMSMSGSTYSDEDSPTFRGSPPGRHKEVQSCSLSSVQALLHAPFRSAGSQALSIGQCLPVVTSESHMVPLCLCVLPCCFAVGSPLPSSIA